MQAALKPKCELFLNLLQTAIKHMKCAIMKRYCVEWGLKMDDLLMWWNNSSSVHTQGEALKQQKRTLIPDWCYIARQLMLTTVFSCLMVTLVVRASARRKQTFPVPSALIPVTLSAATGPWWDLQANPEPNFASSSSLDWVAHRSRPLWSSKDPARKPGRHPPNHFVELSEVPWGLHWEDWPWV